jgi:hypothetical protein
VFMIPFMWYVDAIFAFNLIFVKRRMVPSGGSLLEALDCQMGAVASHIGPSVKMD